MKTAIYIEEGDTQLVLTPENKWEQDLVNRIIQENKNQEVKIMGGKFYECHGGWHKQGQIYQPLTSNDYNDYSMLIRLTIKPKEE